jgi:hypothetical protein
MKTSTALALSLITLLSLRASAQTGDAAFASAFAAAPSAATMAQLRAAPQRPAPAAPAAKPPSAPDDVWAKIVETVKKDGKYKAGADPLPSAFTIEDVAGDAKADHTSNTASFVGEINDDGLFEAMGALFLVREFKLDPKDGNWHVDQWMFMTNVHGEAFNAMHANIIETPAGDNVSTAPDKLTVADPRLKAKYDSMLKYWAERKP